ncbi:DUF302 domain-containing protein [Candidatus Thorarchaeota archaeon]|nr:MAG: DUF302 domain-containing protein [Candidatus Thorarchaeota archaeon]
MVEVLRKEVDYDFDEAVKRVEQICSKRGFSVLATKHLDQIFKKSLNVDKYPRYTMVLACNPALAKMALDVSKDAGTLFPCSFVVYEDQGKTIVAHTSIMRVSAETGLAPEDEMEPVIKETGKHIHKVWDDI